MQQLTVRLHTTILTTVRIFVLSEYRNLTTSEKQKTLTKQTPITFMVLCCIFSKALSQSRSVYLRLSLRIS